MRIFLNFSYQAKNCVLNSAVKACVSSSLQRGLEGHGDDLCEMQVKSPGPF